MLQVRHWEKTYKKYLTTQKQFEYEGAALSLSEWVQVPTGVPEDLTGRMIKKLENKTPTLSKRNTNLSTGNKCSLDGWGQKETWLRTGLLGAHQTDASPDYTQMLTQRQNFIQPRRLARFEWLLYLLKSSNCRRNRETVWTGSALVQSSLGCCRAYKRCLHGHETLH